MTAYPAASTLDSLTRPPTRRHFWLIQFVREQPLAAVGGAIVVAMIAVAVFAPLIAPYDPTSIEFANLKGPSWAHPFGTDDKGRDVFSRVIWGSRPSLEVGLTATLIGTVGGTIVGLVSGYFGGIIDIVLQRVMDAMLAFPLVILALVMVAAFGNSLSKLMIVIGIAIIPGIGRVMRSVVLTEKQSLYIEAAHAIGASTPRIMVRHILPNVVAPIIVVASTLLGSAILIEAALSFLGLGIAPPTPSWGSDLSRQARKYFTYAPWMALFPGLALSLVVFGFNLLGDGLRDALDPRLRGR